MTTAATPASGVGSYPIVPLGASDANYAITFASGSLTITPVPLSITADDKTKVYGEVLPTLTASYSGFVNGDTAANLDTPVTLAATATAASSVGDYSIAASAAADSNYTITFVSGTLTVTRAPLTITADDKTKVYLGTLPPLTASYLGLVNGDVPASLDTPVTLTTTATQTSPLGTYTIVASGGADANYDITFADGTLTVVPISPRLSVIGVNAGAEVILRITGQPGQTLDLQESTDLQTWQSMATVNNPTGAVDYVDASGGAGLHKFYRLQVAP